MSEDFKEFQDMLEQAKELVKTLENKYNELSKPKNVRWRAENIGNHAHSTDKNIYYYVHQDGSINWNPDNNGLSANFLYSTGNYFKTKEEAEKYKNNLIITQKLKDIALRLNNGVEVDWNNHNQAKWMLSYSNEDSKLKQCELHELCYLTTAYCLSPKFLETCIKEIGEKELIEYIKGC